MMGMGHERNDCEYVMLGVHIFLEQWSGARGVRMADSCMHSYLCWDKRSFQGGKRYISHTIMQTDLQSQTPDNSCYQTKSMNNS